MTLGRTYTRTPLRWSREKARDALTERACKCTREIGVYDPFLTLPRPGGDNGSRRRNNSVGLDLSLTLSLSLRLSTSLSRNDAFYAFYACSQGERWTCKSGDVTQAGYERPGRAYRHCLIN
jgi:hypothetical protein